MKANQTKLSVLLVVLVILAAWSSESALATVAVEERPGPERFFTEVVLIGVNSLTAVSNAAAIARAEPKWYVGLIGVSSGVLSIAAAADLEAEFKAGLMVTGVASLLLGTLDLLHVLRESLDSTSGSQGRIGWRTGRVSLGVVSSGMELMIDF